MNIKEVSLKNKKVLITYGPTWVPIDGTRIITNLSSGRLGSIIARQMSRHGAKVTVLEGPVDKPIQSEQIKVVSFRFYDELKAQLAKVLKQRFDIIIHAAAVSDYQLAKPLTQKISSQHKHLSLELVPTEKLILSIKKAQPNSFLVGFKLTTQINEMTAKKTAKALFDKAKCDLVIANSTTDETYSGFILNEHQEFLGQETSREAIAKTLIRIIRKMLVR